MDASAPPPRPQPRYSLSSYASTLPRRIQRTARGTTTPHAPFAERVARWVTVLLLLAAATFWVAYNIRRLTLALPVLQARVVSLGTVAVPGLIVCGGTFDRIGCAVGPTSGSPLGSKDCSDRVSMGGLSVQNYPELRTVFDPRWHCALVDTRGLNASAGADAASASLLPRGARIRRRQFIQSYPLDQPMFFDGNTTGRITLTVYSEALANGTARRPGGGTGSGPGTGPGSSIGSNWILLGRFVVPDSDDDDDMRRATLSAEFDWIEAPAVGSAVVSYSTFMSVRGERRDSLGWR